MPVCPLTPQNHELTEFNAPQSTAVCEQAYGWFHMLPTSLPFEIHMSARRYLSHACLLDDQSTLTHTYTQASQVFSNEIQMRKQHLVPIAAATCNRLFESFVASGKSRFFSKSLQTYEHARCGNKYEFGEADVERP